MRRNAARSIAPRSTRLCLILDSRAAPRRRKRL